MTAKLLIPHGQRTMQFTIFTFNEKWVWTLSEAAAADHVRVLAKSLARHRTQGECRAEVELVKAGISPETKVVLLGEKT